MDLMRRPRNNQKGMPMFFLLGQRVSEEVGFASDTGPPAKIPSLGHYSRLSWNGIYVTFHPHGMSPLDLDCRTREYQTLDLGRRRQRRKTQTRRLTACLS